MGQDDIKIILEVKLVYPYKNSLETLLDFASIWSSKVVDGSTRKEKLLMHMPSRVFKRMFGRNPKVDMIYAPPLNSESFLKSIEVKKIITR